MNQHYFQAVVEIAAAFIKAGEREPEEIIPLSIKVVNAINDQLNGKEAVKKAGTFKSVYSEAARETEAEKTV